jgi:hypothetical protein
VRVKGCPRTAVFAPQLREQFLNWVNLKPSAPMRIGASTFWGQEDACEHSALWQS